MRIFAFAILLLALAGCNPATPPSNDAAVYGPVVSGKLKGQETISYIPFSDYAGGNPVIATEAFAAPGALSVLSAGGKVTKFQNGDLKLLFGAGALTIDSIANVKAAGVPSGSKFYVQGYKSGIANTISYIGTTCYVYAGASCPTSIGYGDAWLFMADIDGNTWRAVQIGNATQAYVQSYAVPQVGATSLAFTTATANRKIQLYPGTNDNQFYGFGIQGGTLRYQVDGPNSSHVFYSGASATASTELFRIYGSGGFLSSAPSYLVTPNATRARFQVAKYTGGTGHTDGPKWNTAEMQYLLVGGREYGSGTIRGIGMGYVADITQFAPAFVGYQEANATGNTTGDLFFATRAVTTNTGPIERLRITSAGDIKAATGYVPATDTSLAPKNYVDGRALSPNAIAAIKALSSSSTLAEVVAALQKQ